MGVGGVEWAKDGVNSPMSQEAVGLLTSSGQPLLQIANELGICPLMLRNWRHRGEGQNAGSARHPISASAPQSAPDPASEISRLRRENDRLCKEPYDKRRRAGIAGDQPAQTDPEEPHRTVPYFPQFVATLTEPVCEL